MTTRSQRNTDYRRTGAPSLQDGAPEPMTGAGKAYWRVVSFIAVLSVIMILAGLAIRIFGG